MGKTMKHWYLKGLGYLAKAERLDDGTYVHPTIYNHVTKRWVADKERKLFKCLNHELPGCEAEKVLTGKAIHELEQIDGIALRFAEDAHEGQLDEDGLPVICHPIEVASMLDDPFEKALAYLHDVVEDTKFTVEDIRNAFGNEVADRIRLLTHYEGDDYVDDYLWCIADDPIATKVKIADLTHNLERDREHPEKDNKERIRKHEGGLFFLIGLQQED